MRFWEARRTAPCFSFLAVLTDYVSALPAKAG